MEFKRATELLNVTPTSTLCDAWALTAEDVDARKSAKTPLTVREAGSLAELHGMRLEDILTV